MCTFGDVVHVALVYYLKMGGLESREKKPFTCSYNSTIYIHIKSVVMCMRRGYVPGLR